MSTALKKVILARSPASQYIFLLTFELAKLYFRGYLHLAFDISDSIYICPSSFRCPFELAFSSR